MMRLTKVCSILIFGIISLSIITYESTSSFYPIISVSGSAVGVVLLGLIIIRQEEINLVPAIFLLTIVALFYRTGVFFLAPSLIDVDPQAYAVQSQWIMETGSTLSLRDGFYQSAALFTVNTAIIGHLFDLRADKALIIYPTIMSILIPLIVLILMHQVRNFGASKFAFLLAVLIAVSAEALISYSFAPRPQLLSVPLFSLAIYASIAFFNSRDNRMIVILCVFLVSLVFLHKLPLFVFVIIMLVSFITALFFGKDIEYTHPVRISIIAIGALILQAVYLTQYIEDIVYHMLTTAGVFLSLVVNEGLETGQSELVSSHAVMVTPSLTTRIIFNSNFVIILVAFIAGLILCYYAWNENPGWGLIVILSASFVTTLLIVLGVLTPAMGPSRFFLYGELFLAILIGFAAASILSLKNVRWVQRSRSINILKSITIVAVVIVLLTQFAVLPFSLDHPETSRMYLNSDEIDAKHFEYTYVPAEVYSDRYYADHVVNPEQPVETNDRVQMEPSPQSDHPGILTVELRNATITDDEFNYVAHRHQVDIYRLDGAHNFRLTWDPERELEREYAKIYDNPGVSIYYHE